MNSNRTRIAASSTAAFILCFLAPTDGHGQGFAPPNCTTKYAFYPQGGNFFGDLYPNNFVDLDTGSGIRDWNCGHQTLDGHNGIDTEIRGFAAQVVGVPVFAVLDGTVIQTHDGEPDMNTGGSAVPSNLVKIDHGGGHTTTYLHLKMNSVAVSVNQQVRAGQQIGLTGSSGNSTGPHLHFQPEANGAAFEPFAGACRAGVSNWITQPSFRTDLYLREFVITGQDLGAWPGYPVDTSRTGQFTAVTQRVGFWMSVGNGESVTSLQARYLRPDGTENRATPRFTFPGGASRNAYFNAYFNNVVLDVAGTWRIEILVNDQVFTQAPFTVLSSGPIVNRPPAGVQAVFDPPAPVAADVVFCRLTPSSFFLDPDYDLPRFRYLWKVNNVVVRDTVSAALSDAIPRNTAQSGDTLSCTVTPSDGVADGPTSTLSVAIATPAGVADRLQNISTRMLVQTGDNALIGGFILAGTDPKQVIIRAIGPSLSDFGVQGALADPTLELRDGTGQLLAENDDWRTGGQEAEIIATTIPPSNNFESAIVRTLPANNASYTAIVRGKNGTTGVGLVEVYDLGASANSRMANISTRGFVETGDNAMIGGFIIGNVNHGGGRVVVRAIGPSLGNFGIPNPLLDPVLEIRDSNGVLLRTNDDWRECQETEIQAIGLAPSDNRESTVLATLTPGAYTGIVRGKNNTTGVALVEVYNLQ